MDDETYLIVEQQSRAVAEMTQLLNVLTTEFQLDSYNCRQLLLGPGQALLTRGPANKLTQLKKVLAEYRVLSHVISPSRVTFSPFVLASLEVHAQTLKLLGREKELSIAQGSRVLILLSELSGALAERSLSQILSDNRYRGTATNGGLTLEKCQRVILQGRPVLDIYLLNDAGQPVAAVRAFPGKFDHHGLGERATLSANQNLLQLIELIQEYAAKSRVDMRFGLSPLPGARLEKAKENDLEGLKRNLRSLTRYGWLQSDIDRQQKIDLHKNDTVAAITAATTLLTAAHPEMAASLPAQQEIMAEFSRGMSEVDTPVGSLEEKTTKTPLLPTPPDAQQHNIWTNPRAIAGFLGLGSLALLIKFGGIPSWLGPLVAKAFATGALTVVLATGFIIAGFRLLQLKRMIQNTPTSRIRSIAMGWVEVHGNARRQYALFSPMTNIPCIFYRLTRYQKNQKNDWVVSSISSSGHVPFWLEDETGRVSIDPSAATVKAEHRQESLSAGGSAFGGSDSAEEKWIEEMIYDGARVYVLGEAQLKKSTRLPRQQRRAEALRRIKQDAQQLSSYDTNGDGQIDAEEWQTAREAVDEKLLREDLGDSQERKRQEDQVVISKPRQRGMPFVIAEAASEEKLTGQYALSITLLFTLATIFCGISLWQLLRIL